MSNLVPGQRVEYDNGQFRTAARVVELDEGWYKIRLQDQTELTVRPSSLHSATVVPLHEMAVWLHMEWNPNGRPFVSYGTQPKYGPSVMARQRVVLREGELQEPEQGSSGWGE